MIDEVIIGGGYLPLSGLLEQSVAADLPPPLSLRGQPAELPVGHHAKGTVNFNFWKLDLGFKNQSN